MSIWKNNVKRFNLYKIDDDTFYFTNAYFCGDVLEYKLKTNVIKTLNKTFNLTEENKQILIRKIAEFNKIKDSLDSFCLAKYKSYNLYYKKIEKTKYQFIAILDSGTIYNYQDNLTEFLQSFNTETLEYDFIDLECGVINHFNKLLPLYDSANKNNDEYLKSLINYLRQSATKEDIELLNEFDGENRIFVDKEIYGIEDITDINNIVLNRHGSMFGWRVYYDFDVQINGKYYNVSYFPSPTQNGLVANCYQGEIVVSNELLDKIKVLTGETENNKRTRELMQLGNFLYEIKKNLSPEQTMKILSDISKVRFEDLKSLPKHWLYKIGVARLYDWLHCSGLSGDKDVSEYIENLVKEIKLVKDKR